MFTASSHRNTEIHAQKNYVVVDDRGTHSPYRLNFLFNKHSIGKTEIETTCPHTVQNLS